MSMAEGDLGAGLQEALGAAPEGTPAATDPNAAPVSQAPAYDTNGLSPQALNVIAGLPEEERAIAAKYIRDWDTKGFQPYAQQVNARLQPYVQLGSHEELAQVKAVFEQLKADPQGFVQTLIDNGFYNPTPASPQAQQAAPPVQYYDVNGQPVQLPAAAPQTSDIASHPQIKRLETALGAMAQRFAAQETAATQREADQQLEVMTQQAEAKHGQFNRLYVYNLMAQGANMDAAVMQWKNEVNMAAQQQQRAPQVMGASSAPPAAPGPLLTSDDRSNALAQYLQSMQQG